MPSMRRIHIFKAGTHLDAHGVKVSMSEADLVATAAAYNPELHEAPFVVGHPKDDGPAYGWAQSIAAQGGDLWATPAQVNPEFAEQVGAGAYKKVSAAFYGPTNPHNPVPGVWYLRHIGFLGAMPPAIKGLRSVAFGEESDAHPLIEIEIEFSEEAEPSSLPSEKEGPKQGADVSPEGSDPAKSGPSQTETTTVTPEEAAALKAKNDQLAAELAAAQTTLKTQATEATTAAHAAFAEGLIAEARIAPADKALVIATLNHLAPPALPGDKSAQVVEFGEGEAKKPMADALKDWLKALPKRVEFSEQASRDRAAQEEKAQTGGVQYAEGTPPEAIELDKRIRAYAKENKVSYAEAANAVAAKR